MQFQKSCALKCHVSEKLWLLYILKQQKITNELESGEEGKVRMIHSVVRNPMQEVMSSQENGKNAPRDFGWWRT